MVVNVVNSAATTAAGAAAATASSAATRSGLQKQVLTLYRRALQAARRKDAELAASAPPTTPLDPSTANPTNSNATLAFVRERFRDDAGSVRRMDFNVIEHLLRKGERDLKMLERMKAANFTRISHGSAPSS
ncbi:hypothetical protein PybrP1_009248 [[Pythium] brassicae (nom. inval.)]|nr:hypothetical protein PybrP1_009248 [[Pythium] brassicae (nom. inval.)]